jgi:hypothetical protein
MKIENLASAAIMASYLMAININNHQWRNVISICNTMAIE